MFMMAFNKIFCIGPIKNSFDWLMVDSTQTYTFIFIIFMTTLNKMFCIGPNMNSSDFCRLVLELS